MLTKFFNYQYLHHQCLLYNQVAFSYRCALFQRLLMGQIQPVHRWQEWKFNQLMWTKMELLTCGIYGQWCVSRYHVFVHENDFFLYLNFYIPVYSNLMNMKKAICIYIMKISHFYTWKRYHISIHDVETICCFQNESQNIFAV